MNTIDQSRGATTEGARPSVGFLSPSNCQLPLPAHKLYVETRGSYGAWLFHKTRSRIEVLNDSDGEAMNLSRALVQQREQTILATAFARMEMGVAADPQLCRALRFAAHIEKAWRHVSAASKVRSHLSPMPLASGLTRLDRAFDRLRNVQIEDGSPCDLIRRYDWEQAFFLCDERDRLSDPDEAEDLIGTLAEAAGSVLLIVNGPSASSILARNNRWRNLPLPAGFTESVWLNS